MTNRLDGKVSLAGIELAHPVLNGSGTYDAIAARRAFGDVLVEDFPFAAFVTKTVTVKPRRGNPPPRLWETAAGLINSIGLPNRGLDGFVAEDLPELAGLPVPLIVSVAGFELDEWALLVERLDARPEVAAVELNVSCPNVKSGCEFGGDREELVALLRRVRRLTAKPLIVKLTPNVADIAELAAAAEQQGADAFAVINTLRAMAFEPRTGRPCLGGQTGGLSGPAVKPVALAMTAAVADRCSLPVVGMGGIATGADARDFLYAGAACVAVGTENFRDPQAGTRIRGELARL